ncbi:MAG TPA: alpha/beta hydrolase, partial [Burkholderiaceae bacterium]|nr:alpha/beta hydrolase [Burkholderiaceae bacterium]
YAAPFARLGKLRSAGITDLRYGSVLAEDWQGRQGGSRPHVAARHLPLPEAVRCYAVAGSLGEQRDDLRDRLLGDGLVPLRSALGQHRDPRRTLAFPADRQWIGYGLHHMDLLGNADVYAQLLRWLCTAARAGRT